MKKIMIVYVMLLMLPFVVLPARTGANLYGEVNTADEGKITAVKVTIKGDVIGAKSTITSKEGKFRFPELPPGTYQIEFAKDGFKTVIYTDVRMFAGKDKNLVVRLQSGAAEPAEIITGESGAAGVRSSTASFNITGEMLQSLPSARNPWSILRLVPGMMLDREDVGGNDSGMQSLYYGHGSNFTDTTWNLDGANITDLATTGTAPTYLNTNAYEEIQVSVAAHDITAQTGGTQLNFVNKRGGSRLSGGFFLYVEDEAFEMKQKLPENFTEEDWGYPGINRLYQYGANLGGPVVRDKLWFFGSYAVQDIHARTLAQTEDASWITGGYGKIDFQFGKTSGYFNYANNNKKKWDRCYLGENHQAPETVWDQTTPHHVVSGSLQQETGNLFVSSKITHVNNQFTLNPKTNKLNNNYIANHQPGPDWYFYYVPVKWHTGSCEYYTTGTKSWQFSFNGSYFVENLVGTDHEIRFGVDYYTGDTTSQTLVPNQRRLFIYDGKKPHSYKEVWWICDNVFNAGFARKSCYLSDTISFGRVTANIGLRYDKETGSFNATTAPGLTFNGTPIFMDYPQLGDIIIPAMDIPAAFEVLSPRLSLAYDISGNGKNVLKASYARYGSQSGNSFTKFLWPIGWREVDVYWDDRDGDLQLDAGEWSEEPFIVWCPWPWPWIYDGKNPNKIDPDYSSPVLTEYTLAFEKVLGEDFTFALNAFYKKNSNLTWDRGMFLENDLGPWWGPGPGYQAGDLETAENWYQHGEYVFKDGSTKPFYERYYIPGARCRTNHGSGTYNTYKALQFVLSKKLSRGWMLAASLTLSDWQSHKDEEEFFDHTNFDFFNGAPPAFESKAEGLAGVYVNSRWQFKIAGLVQLPYGFNLTGVFQAREGYIVPYYELFMRGSGLSWTNMYEPGKKFGDDRLPAFWMLNLGLEKTFRLSPYKSLTLFADGYNITNNAATLNVNSLLGSENTGEVLYVLNPGIYQFGVRINF